MTVMKITITGRQMDVPQDLKPIIEKKLAKYDKFFKDDAVATVKLSELRGRECVELTIKSSGIIYRSEQSDSTFRNALDTALESIERQIRKNKTKLEKRLRDGAISDFYRDEIALDEETDTIFKTKEFAVEAMEPEEAVLRMNMLNHDFFVFVDVQSGETCVVYRRKDGKYGLLIPQK